MEHIWFGSQIKKKTKNKNKKKTRTFNDLLRSTESVLAIETAAA